MIIIINLFRGNQGFRILCGYNNRTSSSPKQRCANAICLYGYIIRSAIPTVFCGSKRIRKFYFFFDQSILFV